MRTTLTIDDDVLAVAKRVAASRKVSTGQALSDLARRGCQASLGRRRASGFVVFDVPADGPTIDPRQVAAAETADDVEQHGDQFQ